MQAAILAINTAFIVRDDPIQFAYRRNGVKKFLWARPERVSGFDSTYEMAHGLASGSIMLKCNDPRRYSLTEYADPIVIASPNTSQNATIVRNGTVATAPQLWIAGPATNPRILNLDDNNRSIKIDLVITAGQTLVVDVYSRRVLLNNVDYSQYMRTDSQWFRMMPGNNRITYSRSNTGASSTLTVYSRDGWN